MVVGASRWPRCCRWAREEMAAAAGEGGVRRKLQRLGVADEIGVFRREGGDGKWLVQVLVARGGCGAMEEEGGAVRGGRNCCSSVWRCCVAVVLQFPAS